ncbi:MAG: hypothetical protein GX640_18005 [Fibrobacter sp.]|nr:hypothetical protein [Fibrobacter sp.]
MDISYEKQFLWALCLTVAVEAAVVILSSLLIPAVKQFKIKSRRIVAAGIIPSVLTLPYLWFILPAFIPQFYPRAISGEIGIFIVESFLIQIISGIPLKYSSLISFLANSISIVTGLLVFR